MGRSPATPPGMRVRTGRFEQLRSRQARHVQSVEIAESQHCRIDDDKCHETVRKLKRGKALFRNTNNFASLRH